MRNTALSLIMCHTLQATAAELELPPIRWWGELGYDLRLESFDEGDNLTEHAGVLRLNAASYLYEPWFATLAGGLGFSLRRNEVGDTDANHDTVTGDVVLRVFPRSRFPFEFSAERSDSRSDTDLTGLATEKTRFGVLQRYTSPDGTSARLGFEHTELSNRVSGAGNIQAADREDVSRLLSAGVSKSFGAHSVIFDSNISHVDMVDSSDRIRNEFASIRHSYRPSASLYADDLLSYNHTDVDQGTSDFETNLLQLNSFGFWTPPGREQLRLNASLRTLVRNNESRSLGNAAYSITPVLGASYQWRPNWLFNGSVGGTGIETEDERQISTFQNANALYTAPAVDWDGLELGWFGQGDVRNNTDDDGTLQSAGVDLGYNLAKSFTEAANTSMRMDWRQNAGMVADTENFIGRTLFSSLSLSWSRRAVSSSSMLRLSASDSRSAASGDDGESFDGNFQIVNFQASVDRNLSGNSVLMGNVTVQTTRQYQPGAFDGEESRNGVWTPTASVDLSYFHRNLFGVPRLSFRSTARFLSDSYFPILDETRRMNDRDDKQWENRVEYSIGRLQLRGVARISRIGDSDQSFVLFQVRRFFGDL